MTQAKHSPGPWFNDDGLIMAARDSSGYQKTVASIYGPDGEAWDADTAPRANAALIEAAPDLLAAIIRLETAAHDFAEHGKTRHYNILRRVMGEARAAIVKAQGDVK